MKNLSVDKNKCIGCGTCVFLAPKSFRMGTDGKAEAINPPGDPQETGQNAVSSCPVSAISWIDE
jgi:ferredoxin